ncbi:MAG: HepT-like ribonuclease domain-containing protein [Candidatus Bathyarchaeia archaeon]
MSKCGGGLTIKVLERIGVQVKLVNDLIGELRVESSYRGIERLVQVIIQALLDLGLMAIAALGKRAPERYSEVGDILCELGLLSVEDSKVMRAMAGLRNLLTHMYARVDRDKVIEASRRLAADALRISQAIYNALRAGDLDPLEGLGCGDLKVAVERLRRALEGRVEAAYLFGGRLKGYALKGDYDVAVLMPEDYSLLDLGLIQVDVTRALDADEQKVDILCLNSASPKLILEALSGVPIIEDSVKTLELKVKAMRELLDLEVSSRLLNLSPSP